MPAAAVDTYGRARANQTYFSPTGPKSLQKRDNGHLDEPRIRSENTIIIIDNTKIEMLAALNQA